ncbi:hypothetical protein HY628_02575 [Candidatus Uhrbacteria bacterium]|nr:hypothetical protein [Candidatus Uhrbacteria bacterium]
MLIITHAAVGAIVGQTTGSPLWAALGGFISHFLIDMIPHGDSQMYHQYKQGKDTRRAVAYVTVDAIASILFVLFLFVMRDFIHPLNVSLGIAFGVLPDLLIGLFETGKIRWLAKFHGIHFYFHNFFTSRRRDFSFRNGFILQLVLLALLQVRVF